MGKGGGLWLEKRGVLCVGGKRGIMDGENVEAYGWERGELKGRKRQGYGWEKKES